VWGVTLSVYLLFTKVYILKKTGINLWKVWWKTGMNNLETERCFAKIIKEFQTLNILYQILKWSTPVVILEYMAYEFIAHT